MAVPKPGELWVPAPGALEQQGLDDYRTLLAQNGFDEVESFEGTEVAIRFAAIETMLQSVFYNIAVKADASSELTATGVDLEQRRIDAGLPEIPPSHSVGHVTVTVFGAGGRLFPDGLEGKLKNGLFVRVWGTQTAENGGKVRVRSREPGKATNVAAGTEVVWTTPPFNVAAKGAVAAPGLRGGTDEETEDQKRYRIQIRRQTRAGGGNWGHGVEVAMAADASIQAAFAYPALGGPSSMKIVIVKSLDEAASDYSRAVPVDTVTLASAAVQSELPSFAEYLVQSATDEDVDVSLALGLAAGNGWRNVNPWPKPSAGGKVPVYSVTTSTEFQVLKSDTDGTSPVEGNQIFWWCPSKQQWVEATVIGASDGGSVWEIEVDTPLVIDASAVLTGDYISPAVFDYDSFRVQWLAQMNNLGPGENTVSPTGLNQNPTRGYRRPWGYESFPYELSSRQTNAFQRAFPSSRVVDVDYLFRSRTAPTVPGSILTAPNVLRLRHFGIYPTET